MITLILITCLFSFGFASCEGAEAQPTHLYKVVKEEQWEKSKEKEALELSKMDDDFIHFAEKHQIKHVIRKFFPNEGRVVTLKVNTKKLEGKLVKEANPGGTTEYYHLYNGKIPIDSIDSVEYHSP